MIYTFLDGKTAARFCDLAVTLQNEIGFLFSNDDTGRATNMIVMNGERNQVYIPGIPSLFDGHVHPTLYGNLEYHPPTGGDFWGTLQDSRFRPIHSLVFEPNGVWTYTPNENLRNEYIEQLEKLHQGDEDNKFETLMDVVKTNSANNGARLAGVYEDENGNVVSISRQKYIQEMKSLIGDDMGFKVDYFPHGRHVVIYSDRPVFDNEYILRIFQHSVRNQSPIVYPVLENTTDEILDMDRIEFDEDTVQGYSELVMSEIMSKPQTGSGRIRKSRKRVSRRKSSRKNRR